MSGMSPIKRLEAFDFRGMTFDVEFNPETNRYQITGPYGSSFGKSIQTWHEFETDSLESATKEGQCWLVRNWDHIRR